MPRSWSQLLGEENAQPEPEADRAGLFSRLRDSLSKSRRALTAELASAAFDPGDDAAWERLEEALIRADVGVPATAELVQRLEARQDLTDLSSALAEELAALLGDPGTLNVHADPSVLLVVGVNGTGKTTTIGKLAERLRQHGHSVVLAAADTFRAAAGEQLEIWARVSGAQLIAQDRGSDPGAVAFDAVKASEARGVDVLIVDTAGRLHTKQPLMDELSKIKRVIEKAGAVVDETFLVLDAQTGQNGIAQARAFTDAVEITGVVLTKTDGSAKGGIVLAVREELGVPVRFVGVGERPDDLRPFDAAVFADRLLSSA
jgi:fused signal recognition particle receptor